MSQPIFAAFIGLGAMGFPIAGHLAKNGINVTVFNRTKSKAETWLQQYKGAIADSPKDAANNADFIFTCVGNDTDLEDVILGEKGIIQGLKPNAILIDHTTASAEIARTLSIKLKENNCDFLDAPVSGGQPGAISGQLTVMCGGQESVFNLAKPIIQYYAKAVNLMGPAGSGQLTKMVNQICIGGLLQGLAEALNFATRAGLDVQKVVDVISKGAAQSWQMDNRHKQMIEGFYEHGFAVDWMRKDFAICFEEARKNGAALPVTELVDQLYAEVQQLGGGRWDTSSLLNRLQTLSSDKS